jgi:hypothetical protein
MVRAYRRATATGSISASRRPSDAVLEQIIEDASAIVQTRLDEIYQVGVMDQAALDDAIYQSAELAIVDKPLDDSEARRIGFEEALEAVTFAAEVWFVDHPDAMRELRQSLESTSVA